MSELSLLQLIAVAALPVLFAITVHEVAHGWVARLHGDRTAEMLGRLTLNPIKHIDPVGTIALPLGMLLLAKIAGYPPLIFGWAKPVPVAQQNLRNPRLDMAKVAVAGPLSNILMAIFWAAVMKFGVAFEVGGLSEPLRYMGMVGVFFNLILAFLNLVPIPPLDGGRIVSNLLPPGASDGYDRLEPYGIPVILVLFVLGILGPVIFVPAQIVGGLIMALFGLN